jgi:hypothetical protein
MLRLLLAPLCALMYYSFFLSVVPVGGVKSERGRVSGA